MGTTPFGFLPPNQINAQIPQGGANGGTFNPSIAAHTPAVAQIAQGVGQLLQGAASMKQAEQAHYAQKYQDAVTGIANGTLVNPDYTQILKWAQRAGIPMKSDVTQQDVQAHQANVNAQYAQTQQDQNVSQVASGLPGNPDMATAASMAQASLPPASSPPPQPSGFFGKTKQAMQRLVGADGGYPQVSMNSPQGQLLQAVAGVRNKLGGLPQQLQNAGEEEQLQHYLTMATKKLGLTQAENGEELMTGIWHAMLQGDPNATELLTKTKIIDSMPIDTLEAALSRSMPGADIGQVRARAGEMSLYMSTGGPALRAKMLDLSKDMAPHFGNNPMKVMQWFENPTDPNNQPGMSAEDQKNLTESMGKVLDTHIGVPVALVGQYAAAQTMGKTDLADKILQTIDAKYPSKNAVESAQTNQRLAQDNTNIMGTLQVRNMEANTQRFETFRKGLEDIGAVPTEMVDNPSKYTRTDYVNAAQLVAAKNNDVAALLKAYQSPVAAPQMQSTEQSPSMFHAPNSPAAQLQQVPEDGNWMANLLKTNQNNTYDRDSALVNSMKSKLSTLPKSNRIAAIATTSMPEKVRAILEAWDPEKEAADMARAAKKTETTKPDVWSVLDSIGK